MNEEIVEDIKKGECTGYECPHETVDKHYIIFDEDIQALITEGRQQGIQAVQNALRGKLSPEDIRILTE